MAVFLIRVDFVGGDCSLNDKGVEVAKPACPARSIGCVNFRGLPGLLRNEMRCMFGGCIDLLRPIGLKRTAFGRIIFELGRDGRTLARRSNIFSVFVNVVIAIYPSTEAHNH